ncbi:fam-g protein, partial [Plasmodium gallinaceum]
CDSYKTLIYKNILQTKNELNTQLINHLSINTIVKNLNRKLINQALNNIINIVNAKLFLLILVVKIILTLQMNKFIHVFYITKYLLF